MGYGVSINSNVVSRVAIRANVRLRATLMILVA